MSVFRFSYGENGNLSYNEERLYRIRRVYTLNVNQVVSNVFHTDGVKVHTSNADGRLQIEHIMYYNRFYQRIRFDGFIADEGLPTSNIQHSKDLEFASDFIHYRDFSSIYEQSEYILKGVYLEVGSPYAYDITSGEDDVASCHKNHESYVSKPDGAFSTRIFSRRNILEDEQDEQDNLISKQVGFAIIKQELYRCLTVKMAKFVLYQKSTKIL
ncbi:uncharacterized protein LOC111054471 isoform X2 [Nilaparvata lugens]|uniref:uncharacterized protein LOC111054471 isoform X2 n=1 Tax=Nilaparvata lugens TaxID=108931 RepID=UPI00193E0FFC|nr:uncharacterized protein LOC111054471 isoform X2 [Nilaparvata lugens]